jgi:hypothetical protein
MNSIDQFLASVDNPFDEKSFVSGNFSTEKSGQQLVSSIHQEQVNRIQSHLQIIHKYSSSRTIVLLGDSGLGKTYLLGRLSRQFAGKSIFIYIDPWVDSNYLWRHILRRVANALLDTKNKSQESFLLTTLKSLTSPYNLDLAQWSREDKQKFINHLRDDFNNNFVNCKEFLGTLYDFINPDLSYSIQDWLRGDELSEDDLQELNIKTSIDNEPKARGMINNLLCLVGKFKPITLCFDQLDNIPLARHGFIDLQALFNFNSAIYNQNLENILVIVSLPRSTWSENKKYIQPPDLADGRVHDTITLQQINLEQVKALWAAKLAPLHAQISEKLHSPIYPLSEQQINVAFPGGKTIPRTALVVGRQLFQQYAGAIVPPLPKPSIRELFLELWHKEFNKSKAKITHTKVVDTPSVVKMLEQVLQAIKISKMQSNSVTNKQNSYYLSIIYQGMKKLVFITEDQNMNNFYHLMKASEDAITNKKCDQIYLVRNSEVGNPNLKGYQIYSKIFRQGNNSCYHLQLSLSSIHYLFTYYELVKLVKSQELFINDVAINLEQLKSLAYESKILNQCPLIEKLGM